MSDLVGAPLDRVDGRAKVTGAAKYSAEWPMDGLLHAYMVLASKPAGRVANIDTTLARAQRGVREILTSANAPRVSAGASGMMGRALRVLQDDVVYYDRQPVALVIADTFERAKYAASLVTVRYDASPAATTFTEGAAYTPQQVHGKPADASRGDARGALAAAAVRVDNVYRTPIEHHNPMEPHATIASWDAGSLTLYDASQGIFQERKRLADVFGIAPENVRVVTKFVGGGFGSKGSTWSHVVLAAMAAKVTGRPVKLVLWRPQMWSSIGFRPQTVQRVALGAGRDGKLVSTIHEVQSQSAVFDEFVEPSGLITEMLYDSPAMLVTHRLRKLNYATPTFMRAPGESSGSFALESAMDELAYAARLDPIDVRLRNYAESDPTAKLPFSSKSLRECYEQGAEAFGWSRRTPAPRSMRENGMLVGYGMATASYPTNRSEASAAAEIDANGKAVVRSGGVDIGTGAYTAFTQIAAQWLGMRVDDVRFELGDTMFPEAPNAGGSQLTASVGSAVKLAALDTRRAAIALAVADSASPLHGLSPEAIDARDGKLVSSADPGTFDTYAAIAERHGGTIAGRSDAKPGAEKTAYSMHAFGAQFAEVRVDPDFGTVRVARMLGAFASGRIVNAKTARSQYIGGMTFGLGMALLEESRADARTGRFMNANLGEYLLPVNADVNAIDAIIVPEDDEHVNEIGVKGIGEIGIVGAAAAIANAVFHATGVRVRDLPIVPEKVMMG